MVNTHRNQHDRCSLDTGSPCIGTLPGSCLDFSPKLVLQEMKVSAWFCFWHPNFSIPTQACHKAFFLKYIPGLRSEIDIRG